MKDLSKYTKKLQHKTDSEFTASPGLDQFFPHNEQSSYEKRQLKGEGKRQQKTNNSWFI